MSVGTDPRYGRLADRVLAAWSVPAGGRVDVKRAILAQWQCEQPSNAWPPRLNNPAYVTLGALHSWGLDLGATCGKQYPSFCLALFPTPEAGADAYAGGVLHGSRYAGALRAARAGQGAAFLRAITSAGWGTRYACCRSAFASLGGKVPAVTPGSTSGGDPNATLASSDMGDWLPPGMTIDTFKAALIAAGIPTDDGHRLTDAEAAQLAATLNWPKAAGLGSSLLGLIYQSLGQANSFFPDWTAAANNVVGNAVNQALAALGELGRNLALLGFALVLLLLGIWVLATANDSPLPKLPSAVPIPV